MNDSNLRSPHCRPCAFYPADGAALDTRSITLVLAVGTVTPSHALATLVILLGRKSMADAKCLVDEIAVA